MGNPIRCDENKRNIPVSESDSSSDNQTSSTLELPSIIRIGNIEYEPYIITNPLEINRNTQLLVNGQVVERQVDEAYGYEALLRDEAAKTAAPVVQEEVRYSPTPTPEPEAAAPSIPEQITKPKRNWFKMLWAKKEQGPQTPKSPMAARGRPEISAPLSVLPPLSIRRVSSSESLKSASTVLSSSSDYYYFGDAPVRQRIPRLFRPIFPAVPQVNERDNDNLEQAASDVDSLLGDLDDLPAHPPEAAAINRARPLIPAPPRREPIIMPRPEEQAVPVEARREVPLAPEQAQSVPVVPRRRAVQNQPVAPEEEAANVISGPRVLAPDLYHILVSRLTGEIAEKTPDFIKANLFETPYLTKKIRRDDEGYNIYLSSSQTELEKAMNREKEKSASSNRFVWKTRDLFRKAIQGLRPSEASDELFIKELNQDRENKFKAFANLILKTPDWLRHQGIFREAAEKVKITQSLEKINTIDFNEVVIFKRPEVKDVSSIAKALFEQAVTESMRTEIANYIQSDSFNALKNDIDASDTKALALKNELAVPGFDSLPNLIKDAAKLLAMVSFYEKKNSMSSTNLAKVFSINLVSETALKNIKNNDELNNITNNYIQFLFALIEHQKRVIRAGAEFNLEELESNSEEQDIGLKL